MFVFSEEEEEGRLLIAHLRYILREGWQKLSEAHLIIKVIWNVPSDFSQVVSNLELVWATSLPVSSAHAHIIQSAWT